jgi:benzoate-CoA ligase family protein
MTQLFNACEYLLDRRLSAGDGPRLALTGTAGELTYAQLHDRVCRTATGLRAIGLQPEQRVLMLMADTPEFVTVYLAAMRVGAIPVPVSTMLRADGVAELLTDSRARLLAVTREFSATAVAAAPAAPELAGILADHAVGEAPVPVHLLDSVQAGPFGKNVYPTTADSPAFWLYTSGTTGRPKAAMHRHGAIPVVCESYGTQVLGVQPGDRCLSSAKAFFAYGLGNSVLFPLAAGAVSILERALSTPETIAAAARDHGATLFFAGPTFFAGMLRAGLPPDALAGVRLAASAAEALPAALYQRWTAHFGIDIVDGLGMTEMLHIFLSNQPGRVRPGTTGVAVPGYELRLLDEAGNEVPDGTPGTLYVRGASAATGYWCRYDTSRQVFQGEWLRTGDTYVRDADGWYSCLGRAVDMLKPGGIWVSPAEVEARLLAHQAVAQAVVVAGQDADGLEKAVAFVILHHGQSVTEAELIEFCRQDLPSVKRPRKVVFTDAYPTTATGKVRRVELRPLADAALSLGQRQAEPGIRRNSRILGDDQREACPGRRGRRRAARRDHPDSDWGERVGEQESAPSGIDTRIPNMARMYDYALGGKDNFAADRAAVEKLFSFSPENRDVPRANRRFLNRAVRFAAAQGIRQFLDLGTGLPSQGHVHEIVREISPGAHVVYVDYDPVVVNHARALLMDSDSVTVVRADIRDPDSILAHPGVTGLIDFSRPVAVLFVAVLHGIPDADDPAGIVHAFAGRLAPGSYLTLSHLTSEGHPPALVKQKEEVFAQSDVPVLYRSRAEILHMFDGFTLVEPGLTPVTRWRGDELDRKLDAAGLWWLGGVGRKE